MRILLFFLITTLCGSAVWSDSQDVTEDGTSSNHDRQAFLAAIKKL